MENKPAPPVEHMGLLLTRPAVALAPDDWTRPATLLANPGAVPRLAAATDEDAAAELVKDVRGKGEEEETRAAEKEGPLCEEVKSSVREEAVVDGVVSVVVVVVAADADGTVVVVGGGVNPCVMAAGGMVPEPATEEKPQGMF